MANRQPDALRKMLRFKDIVVRIGVNRSTIYRWIARGQFPKPVNLADRCVAFYESDIREWQKKKAALETPPLPDEPEPDDLSPEGDGPLDDGPLDDDATLLDEDVLPARR